MSALPATSRALSPRREAYVPVEYALERVRGLSRASIDMHINLYHAYATQANALYNTVRSGSALHGAPATTHSREGLSRRWSFEVSGVRLHEWYFEQLDGQPGQRAPAAGSVAMEFMDESFGGFDAWLADVLVLSETRGVGWVVTLLDAPAQVLSNVWVDLHQLSVPSGQQVVFALDLWEHAYWTQFGSAGRKDYVRTVLDNTDWRVVEQRCVG